MKGFTCCLAVLALLGLAPAASGAVPQLINFQGFLTSPGGAPVANDTYSVTFTIYDASEGGTPLWSESQSVVTTDGVFSTLLGSSSPIPDSAFNDSARYLGITVTPDDEMTPRQKLVSVAYANRVGSLFGASGELTVEYGDSSDTLLSLEGFGDPGIDMACNPPPPVPAACPPWIIATVGNAATAGALQVMGCSGAGWTIRGNGWTGDFMAKGKATFGPGHFNLGIYSFAAGARNTIAPGSNQATIPGGFCNSATANYATVGGGDNNSAAAVEVTIGGGGSNSAAGAASTIGGGVRNTVNPSGGYDVIGGGSDNTTSFTGAGHQTIGGGELNLISSGLHNTIAGGLQNAVINNVNANAIGGGHLNTIYDHWAVIGGGEQNAVYGRYAVVSGGQFDTATGWWSAIGGGLGNVAGGGLAATISGGEMGVASADYTVVGGGQRNNATGPWAAVGGGQDNFATAPWSTVPGGERNLASNIYAVAGGGQGNIASGQWSVIGGGISNLASGDHSTVPGGEMNMASGMHSFAAGTNARAVDSCSFVWSDCCTIPGTILSAPFYSNGTNTFNARATGGVYFITSCDSQLNAAGTTTGVILPAGGSAWSSLSDSTMKRNIRPVDGAEILLKLAALPVHRWSYKSQDSKVEHVGPMAQDFYGIFGLGEDDRHISSLDPDGISLAAIKELHARSQAQKAEIEALKAKLAEQADDMTTLRGRLADLQMAVETILAAQVQPGDVTLTAVTADKPGVGR